MPENDETPGWLCIVKTPEEWRKPFCAALVVGEVSGAVEAAAPILRWTEGKPGREVVKGLRAKGCTVTIMPSAVLRRRGEG